MIEAYHLFWIIPAALGVGAFLGASALLVASIAWSHPEYMKTHAKE